MVLKSDLLYGDKVIHCISNHIVMIVFAGTSFLGTRLFMVCVGRIVIHESCSNFIDVHQWGI